MGDSNVSNAQYAIRRLNSRKVDPAEENWIALDPPNKFQYCGSLDLEVKVQDTVKDELPAVQNLASNQMSLSLKENPLKDVIKFEDNWIYVAPLHEARNPSADQLVVNDHALQDEEFPRIEASDTDLGYNSLVSDESLVMKLKIFGQIHASVPPGPMTVVQEREFQALILKDGISYMINHVKTIFPEIKSKDITTGSQLVEEISEAGANKHYILFEIEKKRTSEIGRRAVRMQDLEAVNVITPFKVARCHDDKQTLYSFDHSNGYIEIFNYRLSAEMHYQIGYDTLEQALQEACTELSNRTHGILGTGFNDITEYNRMSNIRSDYVELKRERFIISHFGYDLEKEYKFVLKVESCALLSSPPS